MFARVVEVELNPERMDEVIAIFRDSISPAAEQQKGSRGGYFLTDPATGKAMSIAFWETEADMTSNEGSGYLNQQVAKIASAFTAAPVVRHYEVSVE